MPWIQKRLKGQVVFARCDEAGALVAEGGRVEVRYKPGDGRAYLAGARNLSDVPGATVLPDTHCGPAERAAERTATAASGAPGVSGASAAPRAGRSMPSKAAATKAGEAPIADGSVVAYADGACTGNPGPAGLGVHLIDGARVVELSEYLGHGTNNIAELTAILRTAERLADETRPIEIRTDSQYAIGVLSKGWKAKANQELIVRVKAALATLRVRFVYVPGHAGVAGNERADALGRAAIAARRTSGWLAVER